MKKEEMLQQTIKAWRELTGDTETPDIEVESALVKQYGYFAKYGFKICVTDDCELEHVELVDDISYGSIDEIIDSVTESFNLKLLDSEEIRIAYSYHAGSIIDSPTNRAILDSKGIAYE